LKALERVVHYLKGTMDYGIHYTGYPRVLEGYSDSNWISHADEIKVIVDMCSHLEVTLFPGSLASIPS
jgi:hypothetical protein